SYPVFTSISDSAAILGSFVAKPIGKERGRGHGWTSDSFGSSRRLRSQALSYARTRRLCCRSPVAVAGRRGKRDHDCTDKRTARTGDLDPSRIPPGWTPVQFCSWRGRIGTGEDRSEPSYYFRRSIHEFDSASQCYHFAWPTDAPLAQP